MKLEIWGQMDGWSYVAYWSTFCIMLCKFASDLIKMQHAIICNILHPLKKYKELYEPLEYEQYEQSKTWHNWFLMYMLFKEDCQTQILAPEAKVPDATRDWDPCKMLRHGEAKTGTSGTGTAFTETSGTTMTGDWAYCDKVWRVGHSLQLSEEQLGKLCGLNHQYRRIISNPICHLGFCCRRLR